MTGNKVKKQLVSLCLGELTATAIFVFVFIYTFGISLGLHIDLIMIYPFCCLIFLLLQGSFYWFYCIKRINGTVRYRDNYTSLYKFFMTFDIIIFLIYPIIFIYLMFHRTTLLFRVETFLGIFIYLFAIAEYVNYFYIRLSYSKIDDIMKLLTFKKIKKSCINKELNK